MVLRTFIVSDGQELREVEGSVTTGNATDGR